MMPFNLLYSLLYLLALIITAPFQFFRRPRELRSTWLSERMGIFSNYRENHDGDEKGRVWIHAVSVGESIAARPLISALRDEYMIFLSTVTDTGRKVSRDFLLPGEELFYVPFDLSFAIRGTLSRVKPDLFILMETEIWPNLIRAFHGRGIPVAMVNGRISEKSFRGYRKIKPLMRSVLAGVDHFCMQSEGDAERITALGAPKERVSVTGNLKFDARPPGELPQWCSELSRPVIVAGSTHEGEEEMIISAFGRLRKVFDTPTLVLAPRHPERFSEVEAILMSSGIPYAKRSTEEVAGKEIVLLDTIGELPSVYGCADICIVGGSFIPRGGHNLFEPAFWGKPIICGPYMENFPLAEEFFEKDAAISAEPEKLYEILSGTMKDRSLMEGLGANAKRLYHANAGAVTRTVEILKRVVAGN